MSQVPLQVPSRAAAPVGPVAAVEPVDSVGPVGAVGAEPPETSVEPFSQADSNRMATTASAAEPRRALDVRIERVNRVVLPSVNSTARDHLVGCTQNSLTRRIVAHQEVPTG